MSICTRHLGEVNGVQIELIVLFYWCLADLVQECPFQKATADTTPESCSRRTRVTTKMEKKSRASKIPQRYACSNIPSRTERKQRPYRYRSRPVPCLKRLDFAGADLCREQPDKSDSPQRFRRNKLIPFSASPA